MKILFVLSVLIALAVGTWAAIDDPCAGPGNTTGVESPCGVCCGGDTGVDCTTGMDCEGVCGGSAISGSFNSTSYSEILNALAVNSITGCDLCVRSEISPIPNTCLDTTPEGFADFGNSTIVNRLWALINNDEATARKRDDPLHHFQSRITLLEVIVGGGISLIQYLTLAVQSCAPAEDCNGVCQLEVGIGAYENECGVCVGGTTNLTDNEGRDCGGVCNGNGTVNECGSCIYPGGQGCDCQGAYDSCSEHCGTNAPCLEICTANLALCDTVCNATIVPDCNGDCGGSAFINSCEYCVGGETNLTGDFGIDCNGDCNGTASVDDCGVCSGGNTLEIPNEDKDCNGTCFGDAIIDPCGVCGGSSTGEDCCNCPRSAGYWKTHSCFSRSKGYRENGASKRLRRDWPGEHTGCEEEICGKRWIDILWTPARGDAWNVLARQYIAAQLNLEAIPCFRNEAVRTQVEGWVADAKTILENNCANGLPKESSGRAAALDLKDQLETFNTRSNEDLLFGRCTDDDDSNDGPDTDESLPGFPGDDKRRALHLENVNKNNHKKLRAKRVDLHTRIDTSCFEATLIQQAVIPVTQNTNDLEGEGILPGEPPLQCVGGFTIDSLYQQNHNGELLHPQTREQWLDGSELELCTVCGLQLYSLIADANNLQFATNDTWLFAAHEWISAVINIRNGACLTQVTADALFDGLELLEGSCTENRKRSHNEEHDFVPLDSELGQAFMEVHDQLESYNNEEWGPWESLLDLLKKKCKHEDCSEETQRGYLIWAIIVTVALVLAICIALIIIGVMASNRNGNLRPTGTGVSRPAQARYQAHYQTHIGHAQYSGPDEAHVWGSVKNVHHRR